MNENLFPPIEDEFIELTEFFWCLKSKALENDFLKKSIEKFGVSIDKKYPILPKDKDSSDVWQDYMQRWEENEREVSVLFSEYVAAHKFSETSVEDRLWRDFSLRDDWPTWVLINYRQMLKHYSKSTNYIEINSI
ncbi:hypothetical protein [Marinomonas balearica]|nr:hypothetical protein [Marinomonas balearica]